jgi:hypothetical protein
MQANRKLLFASCFLLLSPLIATADDASIIVRAVTPESFGGQYRALVDAGALELGSEHQFNITIHNPTNQDMRFDEIIPSCSCMDVRVDSTVLPASGAMHLSFKAPVPESMRESRANWRVSLNGKVDERQRNLYVHVQYQIAGMLQFMDPRSVLELSPLVEKRTFEIPLLITEPVTVDNLEVIIPEELVGIKGKVVSNEGKTCLRLDARSQEIEHSYSSGRVGVVDTQTSKHAEIAIALRKRDSVRVLPTTLRVLPKDDSDDESRYFTAFVEFDVPSFSSKDTSPATTRSMMIDAAIDESPIALEITKVSDGFVKVNGRLTDSQIGVLKTKGANEIVWVFRAFNLHSTLKSRVRL